MVVNKILIIPSWYPTPSSPINGIFIKEQAELLSTRHDVAVYYQELISPKTIWRGPGINLHPTAFTEEPSSHPRLFRRAAFANRFVQDILNYFYAAQALVDIRKIVNRWGRPDIIHAHVVLPAGWVAVNIGKRMNVPVVLTEHTGPFSVHLNSRIKRNLVTRTMSQVKKILPVSPVLAQQISDFARFENTEVLGNLVRTSHFVIANAKENHPTLKFLTVGILTEQKGVGYLLEAARRLHEEGFENFQVLIGGDGPQRGALEQMVQSWGLQSIVQFLGALNREQVRSAMQASDVFVLASLHETFGIVMGEAMACGLPVISTRNGGAEFVVTPETGYLMPTRDSNSLAQAMKSFLLNENHFDPQKIRESISKRFGEEAFLNNIDALYREVLGSKAA